MTITNTKVVDTTSKYIVQSKGIGNEEDQIVVDAEKLTSGNNQSKVNLIECYYRIKKRRKLYSIGFSYDDYEYSYC